MANVLFKFGTKAAYNSIDKLSNALYFITDTGELFKGDLLIANKGKATVAANPVGDSITPNNAYDGTPTDGEIFVLPRTDGTRDVYVWDGEDFVPLNADIPADQVIVGKDDQGQPISLASALENVEVSTDDASIVNDANAGLMVNGFGKGYYKWDENTSAYVYTAVSVENPWKAGLVPKVVNESGVLKIGWYEPSASDGSSSSMEDAITAVQQQIDNLNDVVITGPYDENTDTRGESLVDKIDRIEDLVSSAFHFEGAADALDDNGNIVITGTGGAEDIVIAPSNDNKGAIYQVGDKEYASDGSTWVELGFTAGMASEAALDAVEDKADAAQDAADAAQDAVDALDAVAVKSISVPAGNGSFSSLTPVNGVITLPEASTATYGLVKFNGTANQVLMGNGTWAAPQDSRIGDLTDENNQQYDTVEEYIQHYITNIMNNMSLEWEELGSN